MAGNAKIVNDAGTQIASVDSEKRLHVNAKLVSSGSVSPVEAGDFRLEKWQNTPIVIPDTGFTDAYTNTSGSTIIYEAIWQLNTDKMDLRIEVDNIIVLDCDLDELKDDFKLKRDDKNRPGFTIVEYDSKRWRFRPPAPIRVNNTFKLQFKSQNGNKKVQRGITVWGKQ